MAYASKQIRDWTIAALTGYGALPAIGDGAIRVVDTLPDVRVSYGGEELEESDINDTSLRILAIEVHAIAATLNGVDALCLDIEKGIAVAASYPGAFFELRSREYTQELESDRDQYQCILSYDAAYYLDSIDPETIL